ncbi:MAG TPA: glycosyltransferase family A protein [Polyangiaceae bacterium]
MPPGATKGSPAEPKEVTLILSYYENPRMLARQLETIASYDAETRHFLRLIVVDDGSPEHPAAIEDCAVDFSLYRCLVDVPWNSDFCRNLAVSQASTEWVMLTDIDHLVPAKTAHAIVHKVHAPDVAHQFSRVSAPRLRPNEPHPNTYLLTRALFDAVGGYDERLSGFYGTDYDFRRRLRARASIELLKNEVIRVPREVIADASTTRYSRKTNPDRFMRTIRRDHMKEAPLRLTFPWEKVK